MIFHRRGASVSRVPLRMVVPAESVTVSVLAVNRAVHPASQSVPMLMIEGAIDFRGLRWPRAGPDN